MNQIIYLIENVACLTAGTLIVILAEGWWKLLAFAPFGMMNTFRCKKS